MPISPFVQFREAPSSETTSATEGQASSEFETHIPEAVAVPFQHIAAVIAVMFMLVVVCMAVFPFLRTLWGMYLAGIDRGKVLSLKHLIQTESGVVLTKDHGCSCYIPVQLKNSQGGEWFQLVCPQLTESTELSYETKYCALVDLQDYKIPSLTKWNVIKAIAPIVKERMQLAEQLQIIRSNLKKVQRLQELVRSSEFYATQVSLCERVYQQQQCAIAKAQQLLETQDRYIREALIMFQIAEFEVTALPVQLPGIDSRIQQLQQQYQEAVEFYQAYQELLYQSQSEPHQV